ncbi:hypothetical protein [uncultured Algoriphagus sp.]|uniref:hypothetical protein n=1 Tax=uncultured Algoriphagus sp. TaxID=417365 RepID=UPI0030ED6A24|tara:strand:+ start:26832 stop:28454 length:1623 start_codon:yes stop_codon:yes gene_type:complete
MIQFEPLISWTWAWLFASAIILILGVQLFWISKSDLNASRKAIKIALNGLFCLVLIAYVFQPLWSSHRAEEAILLHSAESAKDKIRYWKDSLRVKKSVAINNYKAEGNPVYLLGSDFSEAELLKIAAKDILWIPDFEDGSISFLEWKGFLRESEMQAVKGKIVTQESMKISISNQGETLAETVTDSLSGTFKLEFPATVVGRNELKLIANDSLLGYVNFFTRKGRPIKYHLQFGFPDAEIRTLTQFLINSGKQVTEQIDISRNSILSSGNTGSDSLEFLIIDPAQLSKKSTLEAIESGASVLVINLYEVASDIAAINKTFETNFKAKRATSEERREIANDLDAEPYEFEPAVAQKFLFDHAVAMEQIGNAKVGVSLLGKTFPIKLAGDSLRYQAVWKEILGVMIPSETEAIELTQPVFNGLESEIQLNREKFQVDYITIESDSVFLQPSLVNPFSKTGRFVSLDSGWVSLGDSLEYYSYLSEEWPSLQSAKLRADFLTMQSKKDTSSTIANSKEKISDWLWFGMFLLVLTLIWLEPKVLN